MSSIWSTLSKRKRARKRRLPARDAAYCLKLLLARYENDHASAVAPFGLSESALTGAQMIADKMRWELSRAVEDAIAALPRTRTAWVETEEMTRVLRTICDGMGGDAAFEDVFYFVPLSQINHLTPYLSAVFNHDLDQVKFVTVMSCDCLRGLG